MRHINLVSVILVLLVALAACGRAQPAAPTAEPSAAPGTERDTGSGFPTGRFIKAGTTDYGLMLNPDGTFSVFDGDMVFVHGTYQAEGNVFTETSNDGGCNTDVSFTYNFDGTNLTLNYAGDPNEDVSCSGRHQDFNNVTYTLSKESAGYLDPSQSAVEIAAAAAATPAPAPSESPLPVGAWNLDGDGAASVGDLALEFTGAYQLSDTAVSFDGYTGRGSTTAPGPIDTTASFSISAWANYAARASSLAEAVSQLGEVTGLFNLGVGDTGRWWFMMKTEDRTGVQYSVRAEGVQAVPSKGWTHLVGIFDQEAGLLRLYINGEQQAEAAFAAPLKAAGPLVIGGSQFDSHPGNFWPGAIGEVTAYQAALSAEQVAEIYQTTKPASPPPPQPAPDPSTYAGGLLDGTWDYVLSIEEAQFFLNDYGVTAEKVSVRLGFDNHEWWEAPVFDDAVFSVNGVPEGDRGTFRIEGDRLISLGASGQAQVTFEWVLDGDELTLTVVEECDVTRMGLNCRDDRAQMDPIMIQVMEHTYTKSGDDGGY